MLVLSNVALAGLYVRERTRKASKTYRQVSEEQERVREQQKAEARRTIVLISNEVASNRRLIEEAFGIGAPSRFTSSENWVAHRHALAMLEDAAQAYARTQEAYDAFAGIDELNSFESTRNPTNNELHAAAEKASAAEAALENLLGFVEGPRTRWAVATDR